MSEILIVGSGAMALLFGARLSAGGYQVILLGSWQDGVQAVNQSGIIVEANQTTVGYPARAISDLSQMPRVKMALVLVKSWQTERAARQLSQVMDPEGIVLSLQNGLGNLDILGGILGEERAAQGVTTYGATLLGPGRVRPGGEGIISVQEHPRLDPLIHCLQDSEFSTQIVDDLSGLIWSKLIINVAINPITALLGVKNGQLLHNPSALTCMGLAAEEAGHIATKLGIELGYSDPASAAEAVAAATKDNISSMLQDIRRGAPTEIDALCGAVVRAGQSLNMKTPINEMLLLLIKAREGYSRKTHDENH